MKLFWMILAGACMIVAAVFLLRGDVDGAFVAAALGLVAWFLNYRVQMKQIIVDEDEQRDDEESYDNANEE